MSVTETTRYIYCHAIDWLRISSCYQIYIYIHLYLLTKISRTEKKEGTSTIFSKKNYSNPPKYISVLQESRFQSLFSFFQNVIEARDWLITNFEKRKRKITIPPSNSSIEFQAILKFKQFSRKLGLGVYQNLDLSLVRGPVENVGGRG